MGDEKFEDPRLTTRVTNLGVLGLEAMIRVKRRGPEFEVVLEPVALHIVDIVHTDGDGDDTDLAPEWLSSIIHDGSPITVGQARKILKTLKERS